MANKVAFELVSPDRLVMSVAAAMVVIPGTEGDFGVLAGHQPVVSGLRPGVIEIHDEGAAPERVFVRGGFAEVTNEACVVLAEEAVPVAELDRATLEARIRDTEEDLADATTDDERHHAEGVLQLLKDMLSALS